MGQLFLQSLAQLELGKEKFEVIKRSINFTADYDKKEI
jgi:hypothetical protein